MDQQSHNMASTVKTINFEKFRQDQYNFLHQYNINNLVGCFYIAAIQFKPHYGRTLFATSSLKLKL